MHDKKSRIPNFGSQTQPESAPTTRDPQFVHRDLRPRLDLLATDIARFADDVRRFNAQRLKFKVSVFLFLAFLFLAIRPLAAQGTFEIYNNLQPGDDFDNANSSVVNITDEEFGLIYQSIAMPFTVPTGTNFNLSVLSLGMAGGPADLTISLREDNAGLPGTVIESINGTVTGPKLLYAFTSSLNPQIDSGVTYWVVAEAQPENSAVWCRSDSSSSADSKWSNNGTTWQNDGWGFAMKVEATPVPEPSAALLGGFGALLILGLLRCRKLE